VGYFASESDFRYHDEITGDVFSQPGKVLEILLTKYLKAGISYEGIQRIPAACRDAGTPEPRIDVDGRDVWVGFPFSRAYLDQITGATEKASDRTPQETTQETTQEQILALLRQEPTLTRKAIAERSGITADGIKNHLDHLRHTGRIRHVEPTKTSRWEVLGESN
jgi:ATP-dependent DNA helicase RecG